MADLRDKAMLIKFSRHMMRREVKDQKVTSDVAEQANVERGVGRYTKQLFDKVALKPLMVPYEQAYEYHMHVTLPWFSAGQNLLPNTLYFAYKERMDAYIERYISAREAFLADYEAIKADQRIRLNDLFNEDDYDSPDTIRAKTYIEYVEMPMPSAHDFRVEASDEENERIRQKIERSIQQQVESSVHTVYERFYEVIQKANEGLTPGPDGKPRVFRDTLIENLQDMVNVLPALNITEDGDLHALCNQVQLVVQNVRPNEVRENNRAFSPDKFNALKSNLEQVRAQMAGYFGPAPAKAA